MMSVINGLVLSPLTELKSDTFIEGYSSLSEKEKDRLIDIVLINKISAFFLSYINKNKLAYLFKNRDLRNLELQKKRFQIQALETIKEIKNINKLCVDNKIQPIFLKGAALIGKYDEIGLRSSVDIDIIFSKKDLLSGYECFIKNGFKQYRQKPLKKNELISYMESKHHLPPLYSISKIMIEFHHRVTKKNDFKICTISENILKHNTSLDFFGDRINVPQNTELIIHQLVHFSINSRFKNLLRVFFDIKQIEKKNRIDWEKIYMNNKDIKIRKALSLSLEIINRHYKIGQINSLRKNYKEFFPEKSVIDQAYEKTFSINSTAVKEEILVRLAKEKKLTNFYKTIKERLFLDNEALIQVYKIKNKKNLFYFRVKSFFQRVIRHAPKIIGLYFGHGAIQDEYKKLDKIYAWIDKK